MNSNTDLEYTRVDVKRRSGHDKSFKNLLTTKVGTLTPLAYKLSIPNSDHDITIPMSAALPPLASDTFMRCSLKAEAFMVPMRLLYGGFTSWLTGEGIYEYDSGTFLESRAKLPYLQIDAGAAGTGLTAPGSLMDYLGLRGPVYENVPQANTLDLNIFPALCYHRIYDDWYRNRKVQKPLFGRPAIVSAPSENLTYVSECPYVGYSYRHYFGLGDRFIDGSQLYSLHQRNWGSDYFTEAMPTASGGSPQRVSIDQGNSFTISAFRIANAMDAFDNKNNIASPALQDYCRINYGAKLSDGVAQRAVYLGSASYDVYSKGVFATSPSSPTNNPFDSVGARYGSAFASGADFHVRCRCDEPCYIMVIVSLVPEANYSTGLKHDLMIFTEEGSLMDLPNPTFELIGNEPIYSVELGATGAVEDYKEEVFAWQRRYTWFKTAVNEIHGEFVDGQSLASFVAQRSLYASVLGSDFLKIGTDALDNVTAVTGDLSKYGVMIDSHVLWKVSEPLGESALPSLVDPAAEHGESIYVRNQGSRL